MGPFINPDSLVIQNLQCSFLKAHVQEETTRGIKASVINSSVYFLTKHKRKFITFPVFQDKNNFINPSVG